MLLFPKEKTKVFPEQKKGSNESCKLAFRTGSRYIFTLVKMTLASRKLGSGNLHGFGKN